MFDIYRARVETRACEAIIHVNNAGSSLMAIPVSDRHEDAADHCWWLGIDDKLRYNRRNQF